RLVLYRPEGAAPVTVRRAGRSLEAPFAKPVILLDKDEVDVGSRHLRIHVHGKAPAIAAPAPLKVQSKPLGRLARSAATAAAVIGAATACIEIRPTPPEVAPWTDTPTVEVRDNPPEVTPDIDKVTVEVRETPPEAPVTIPPSTIEVRLTPPDMPAPAETPTIEIRETPPEVMVPPTEPVVGSVWWALQGPWTVTQTYAVEETPVFSGTLTVTADGRYWFTPLTPGMRPDAEGTLNFLFDNPRGYMSLDYAAGIIPESLLTDFAPGTVLATWLFSSGSPEPGPFQIVVGDNGGLYFAPLSGTAAGWQITR
ncbi:MAG: hypothetical protein JXA21_26285, partial [Anaerolineae bacterium]|nr:hypothetical protein [Anaerolineae bacterium]